MIALRRPGDKMKYKLNNNSTYIQIAFAALLILVPLILRNILYISISIFIGILMLRDAFKNLRVEYQIDQNGIKLYANEKIKKEIEWKDVEFLTISKKNKKWIVIGNKKVTIIMKPSIINFEELIDSTTKYVSKRKKVYVHESLL